MLLTIMLSKDFQRTIHDKLWSTMLLSLHYFHTYHHTYIIHVMTSDSKVEHKYILNYELH
jgi:hypothetical protein